MGLISWLFGSKKETPIPKKQTPKKKKIYGFDEKRSDYSKELEKIINSNIGVKKIKIVIDKQDLDTCAAIKRMKKIYPINEVPAIPLDREKCKHCTCYYEPIIPRD